MGLLDDAIREHLDLKRRRGGDPAEIERAEREALGPVRRNREIDPSEEPAYAEAGAERDEDDGGVATDIVEQLPPEEPLVSSLPDSYIREDEDPFGDDAEGDYPLAEDEAEDPFTEAGHDDPFAEPEAEAGEADPFAELESEPRPSVGAGTAEIPPADEPPPTRLMRAAELPEPGDATEEHELEPPIAEQAEGDDDEDVLEETPEFLQDTPNHDRLWFEQRPPRDFDFDG